MKIRSALVFLVLSGVAITASARSYQIKDGPWFACVNKDIQRQSTKIAVSGDKTAFTKFMLQALTSGQCISLKDGQQVFLQETAALSGLVQVRPAGATQGYWTNIEAVNTK